VAGALLGIGCSIGSLLLIPREGTDLWITILIAFLVVFFGALIGFLHDFLIAREKAPWLATIGLSVTSTGMLGAQIGMGISRGITSNRDFEDVDWARFWFYALQIGFVMYLLGAFIGAVITNRLTRCYYANALEKLEKERTPKRRMACRY
jgi:ABC-type spermidine/putrescine transport system permease subunit II